MKRKRCEWCGATRLAKFIKRWPSGEGCRNEDACERIAIRRNKVKR